MLAEEWLPDVLYQNQMWPDLQFQQTASSLNMASVIPGVRVVMLQKRIEESLNPNYDLPTEFPGHKMAEGSRYITERINAVDYRT